VKRKSMVVYWGGVAGWFLVVGQVAVGMQWKNALDTIHASGIKMHIDVLADDSFEGREAGTRGGQAAGDYLAQQLERLGLQPAGDQGTYYQQFRANCRNILGVIHGSDPRRQHEYIVVGAHYDHVGYGTHKTSFGPLGVIHNGADDNASGVAGVLAVIEAFLALDQPSRRSILFAFWDGEEQGLWGSKYWTKHPTVPLHQVVMKINADMIGHLREEQVFVFGTRTATGLRRLVSHENVHTDLAVDFPWELKANSDHHPFFARDVPVLMLHTGLNDFYHRPLDQAHRINHQGSQQVARLMFAIAYQLANSDAAPEFRPASRLERPSDLVELERPLPARTPRLGVSLAADQNDPDRIMLTQVFAGLPADHAGLRPGDVLLRFADAAVKDVPSLLMRVLKAESPTSVLIRRQHEGDEQEIDLSVSLNHRPLRLGVSWREDDAEPGTLVLSEVIPHSPADAAGLQVADRIYEIDGRTFAGGGAFRDLVATWTGPMPLLLERQGRLRTVTVELPSR
jgi:hypothetical protein